MEKLPKLNTEEIESQEQFAEAIEQAKQLYGEIKKFADRETINREEYILVENLAAALSSKLVLIPNEIRLANGLPGGTIFAPREAANEDRYQVAA